MKWSKYQENIFTEVERSSDNLVIDAVAGSGKTTTNVEIAKRARSSGLALAFNKRIAEELNVRLGDSSISAMTLNALGHRAWAGVVQPRLKVNTDKLFSIGKDLNLGNEDLVEIVSLVRAAKSGGLVPSGLAGNYRSLVDDSEEGWNSLIEHNDLDISNYEPARELLIESIIEARKGNIDFDDQVYMPTIFSGKFQLQPLVLIDESQDLSPLQHLMLKRITDQNSRVIAVGDPRQSIYGFRGAMDNSMAAMARVFDMNPLPLSVCYRCGKEIVREAQSVVPHIEFSENSPLGEVLRVPSWSTSDIPASSAILCRNNAPLLEIAMKLLSERRPVNFLGRDICKGILKLIDKITKPRPSMSIEEFTHALRAWEEREIAQKPRSETRTRDKSESLRVLAEGTSGIAELKRVIGQLQSSRADAVVLSSIHRSKGFEWDTVFFLNEYLIPSKYAIKEWQLQQEENARYIAITRAKSRLIYVEGAPK